MFEGQQYAGFMWKHLLTSRLLTGPGDRRRASMAKPRTNFDSPPHRWWGMREQLPESQVDHETSSMWESTYPKKIYIYISKHIGIRFATKGAEAMDMTKRSTKTMTKSLLESCSTSTLSHAQLTGNISWILTLGSFDSVRFLWMDWEVQKQQQWNGLRSLGRQRPRRIPDHFRVDTSVPQHISEAAGSSSLLRTLEHLLFLWEVCAAMSCLLTPQDPRMGG